LCVFVWECLQVCACVEFLKPLWFWYFSLFNLIFLFHFQAHILRFLLELKVKTSIGCRLLTIPITTRIYTVGWSWRINPLMFQVTHAYQMRDINKRNACTVVSITTRLDLVSPFLHGISAKRVKSLCVNWRLQNGCVLNSTMKH